jgi:hypothetical protein
LKDECRQVDDLPHKFVCEVWESGSCTVSKRMTKGTENDGWAGIEGPRVKTLDVPMRVKRGKSTRPR